MSDSRTLPNRNWFTSESVAAEQAVIGSMLVDDTGTAVALAVSGLAEEDFLMESDKALFRAFRGKYLAGEVADPVTVLNAVAPGDRDMLDYLRQLMEITPTAANVSEYIRITKERSQVNKLRIIAEEIRAVSFPQDAMEHLARGMDLLSQDGRDDESNAAETMTAFLGDLKRTPQYLPWGFDFLNENVYTEKGDFVIIAGRPSDGKTALALHMAYEQAKTLSVGFFSLETGRLKLAGRLASAVSGIPLGKMKSRTTTVEEQMLIASAANEIAQRSLTFIDAAGWTAAQIGARTLARRFDVIYIDYLQLIAPGTVTRRENRTSEVADISRSLATLARRHKVAVVALSQLSRPQDKTKRRTPVLADLRESGQIEQDADAVMFIWRQSETDSQARRFLTLAKNKEGMMGDWDLCFRGEIQRFIPERSGKAMVPRDLPEGWDFVADNVETPF